MLVNEFYPHVIQYMKERVYPSSQLSYTILSDTGEFKSNRVKQFLSSHGVRQMFTCPYKPEHNGLIERLWQTFHTMASTMMNEKHVPTILRRHIKQLTTCITVFRLPQSHHTVLFPRINCSMVDHLLLFHIFVCSEAKRLFTRLTINHVKRLTRKHIKGY